MHSAAQMLVGVLGRRASLLAWLMRRYAFRKPLGPAGRIAAWRALGAAIAPEVASMIGDRAVIATGSVVSGEIPADAVAVGNPARRVRDRPAAAFTYMPGRDFA
jgi:hypothetical protein